MTHAPRFISAEDVRALGLGLPEMSDAVGAAFAAASAGAIAWRPKASFAQPDGAWFMSTFGAWPDRGTALFHSIAGIAATPGRPGPHYRSHQLVTDYATTLPLALVDGTLTSTYLPACVTLLAARKMARRESSVVAFVAAGEQARVNLEALRSAFALREVRIASRSAASAERFAATVRESGLAATVTDPNAAIDGADIIVTSVPSGSGAPFLDPARVAPGAFLSAVDLGRSWTAGFDRFDRRVTDDRAQAVDQVRDGRLPHDLAYEAELGDLLTGRAPGRERPEERTIIVHPGNLVGVFGLTSLILDRLGIAPTPGSAETA